MHRMSQFPTRSLGFHHQSSAEVSHRHAHGRHLSPQPEALHHHVRHGHHHVVHVSGASKEPIFDQEFCDIGANDESLCAPVPADHDLHPAPAPPALSTMDRLQEEASSLSRALNRRYLDLKSSTLEEAWSRGKWLLGLLVLQSLSSVVLERYEDLIREHLVVTLFLTMLVGAGGNAGNQSAIKVIRGLATHQYDASLQSAGRVVAQQAGVGLVLGLGLSAGGFTRVLVTDGNVENAVAISASLFIIVLTSVVLGSALPFTLANMGIDPSNAGTTIQVFMDILGVLITCSLCTLVLDQLHGILIH